MKCSDAQLCCSYALHFVPSTCAPKEWVKTRCQAKRGGGLVEQKLSTCQQHHADVKLVLYSPQDFSTLDDMDLQ